MTERELQRQRAMEYYKKAYKRKTRLLPVEDAHLAKAVVSFVGMVGAYLLKDTLGDAAYVAMGTLSLVGGYQLYRSQHHEDKIKNDTYSLDSSMVEDRSHRFG